MYRIQVLLAGGVALAFLSAPVADAQPLQNQQPQAATPDIQGGEQPCEIAPGEDRSATLPDDGSREPASETDGSLSATLDRCGGVLQPPPVGDPGMVEPAPDEGETPVIPPSAIPEDE